MHFGKTDFSLKYHKTPDFNQLYFEYEVFLQDLAEKKILGTLGFHPEPQGQSGALEWG